MVIACPYPYGLQPTFSVEHYWDGETQFCSPTGTEKSDKDSNVFNSIQIVAGQIAVPSPSALHAQLMSMGGMHASLWSWADHAAVQSLRKHICVWARADRREKGETIIIINAMTLDHGLQQ